MSSDEDNVNFHPGITRALLQIKPTQSRQTHIKHQAAGQVRALAVQEFLSRGEEFDSQPNRPNEVLERLAHRCIIIDDEHHCVSFAHDILSSPSGSVN
jgi:hypothetical protein